MFSFVANRAARLELVNDCNLHGLPRERNPIDETKRSPSDGEFMAAKRAPQASHFLQKLRSITTGVESNVEVDNQLVTRRLTQTDSFD